MQQLIISGGHPLRGEIAVQGSKNSALPILAASLLAKGTTVIENCPDITDVRTAIKILILLGCRVSFENHTVTVDSTDACSKDITEELSREMRSSVVFLGALLAREKEACAYYPGGCQLGKRPIDLHLYAFRRLGFSTGEIEGRITVSLKKKHKGRKIKFPISSVGATENAMLAAVTAKGRTVIQGAAQEPEIWDLADFLNRCGAKINGAGTSVITIEGTEKLSGCRYRLPSDRIAAATLLCGAAAAGGEVTLRFGDPFRISELFPYYEEAGCQISFSEKGIHLQAPETLRRVKRIRTAPYPAFSTDAQPLFMAMLLKAKGISLFSETVFESRFGHVPELEKLGADISVSDRIALVRGVDVLRGGQVTAPDLRGGAALLIAALSAEGETVLNGVEHMDRGYEEIEKQFSLLGAKIERKQ